LISTKEIFYLMGNDPQPGWLKFYSPYVKSEETIIPSFREGQKVVFKEVTHVEMLTFSHATTRKPPPEDGMNMARNKSDKGQHHRYSRP